MTSRALFEFTGTYDLHANCRAQRPVYWSDELSAWLVFRYSDVRKVLLDSEHFSADATSCLSDINMGPMAGLPSVLLAREQVHTMNNTDPPLHGILRKTIANGLSANGCPSQTIRPVVSRVVDNAQEAGIFDFVNDIARPVALLNVMEFLNINEVHLQELMLHTAILREATRWCDGSGRLGAAERSMGWLQSFIDPILDRTISDPESNPLSSLISMSSQGGDVSRMDVVASVILLLVAGQETAASLVSSALYRISSDPALWRKMESHPDTIPGFLQETLRLESPVQAIPRFCTKPTDVASTQIKAGDTILLMLSSANRDPELFADPDKFRIDRDHQRHLAFGAGVHFCPGHSTGRLVATAILQEFLGRFPNGPPNVVSVEHDSTLMFRGMKRLWIDNGKTTVMSSRSYISAVEHTLSSSLISKEGLRDVLDTADMVPGTCAQAAFGFECSLSGSRVVDIGYELPPNGEWVTDLLRLGHSGKADHHTWKQWKILAEASQEGSTDVGWAEFDASTSRSHLPSLFWQIREGVSRPEQVATIQHLCNKIGQSAPLGRLISIPDEWRIDKFGFMLSRDETPLRICMRAPLDAVRSQTSALVSPELHGESLERLLDLLTTHFPRVDVAINADQDRPTKVGFECSFPQGDPAVEPAWLGAMSALVDHGCTDKDRVDGMFDFCGVTSMGMNSDQWPPPIRVLALRNLFEVAPALIRNISHVKVVIDSISGVRTKAYLVVRPKWISLRCVKSHRSDANSDQLRNSK